MEKKRIDEAVVVVKRFININELKGYMAAHNYAKRNGYASLTAPDGDIAGKFSYTAHLQAWRSVKENTAHCADLVDKIYTALDVSNSNKNNKFFDQAMYEFGEDNAENFDSNIVNAFVLSKIIKSHPRAKMCISSMVDELIRSMVASHWAIKTLDRESRFEFQLLYDPRIVMRWIKSATPGCNADVQVNDATAVTEVVNELSKDIREIVQAIECLADSIYEKEVDSKSQISTVNSSENSPRLVDILVDENMIDDVCGKVYETHDDDVAAFRKYHNAALYLMELCHKMEKVSK